MAKSALPFELIVRMDDDGEGKLYPVAFSDVNELDDGDRVGIYQFVRAAKVSKKAELK